jgi:hypothetical protein
MGVGAPPPPDVYGAAPAAYGGFPAAGGYGAPRMGYGKCLSLNIRSHAVWGSSFDFAMGPLLAWPAT